MRTLIILVACIVVALLIGEFVVIPMIGYFW